ncbi:UNVERIFIED_CONTAM: hypothetical protein RMT77_012798 [Armadillidium vulgare]
MAEEGNEPIQQPLIPGVHAHHDTLSSFVNFKNCTNSSADIIWLNYEGIPVPYGTLPPSGNLKLRTYESHPWVFRDSVTLEKFQVNREDVFMPIPFVRECSNHRVVGPVSPRFITQSIHYPLYNLKERASQVVLKCLSDPLKAYELDIPVTLKSFLTEKKFRH